MGVALARTTGGRQVSTQRSVGKESFTDRLYREIRDSILSWRVSPNQILVETQLAKDHGVSKTPVREALALLSQEGLVEVIPRVGYRVVSMTPEDVDELFDLRVVLETQAVAMAATRATDEELEDLCATNRLWNERLGGNEIPAEEYNQRHQYEFHLRIAELSGNRRLARFVDQMLREWERARRLAPTVAAWGLVKDVMDSERICVALITRDQELVQDLMRNHITGYKDHVRDVVAAFFNQAEAEK